MTRICSTPASQDNHGQRMNRVYGARHDLEATVTTHLFVICPNNSGSTFLKEALATCRMTWNLDREGQHMLGFAGPSSRATRTGLLWASRQRYIDLFTDDDAYDWPRIRKAWYFQAYARDPAASVFVTKSPPFLLNVAAFNRNFPNPRFLFLVRNPYAVVEGIWRRRWKRPPFDAHTLLHAAARHAVTCLEYQRCNVDAYRDNGRFFTYEAMCDRPLEVEAQIRSLVPDLDDIKLRQKLAVKGMYDEILTNMNDRQIGRLDAAQIDAVNSVFRERRAVLDHFGYPFLEPQ